MIFNYKICNDPRLTSLHELDILDTPPEPAFDEIVQSAAQLCRVPVALLTMMGKDRQWFKAKVGVNFSEMPIEASFCRHVITNPRELLVIPDMTKDACFAAHPLVVGPEHVRFYAGAALLTEDGHAVGTLCLVDFVPREMTEHEKLILRTLARAVAAQLDIRRKGIQLAASNDRLERILANVPGGVYQGVVTEQGNLDFTFIGKGCEEVFEVPAEYFRGNPNYSVEAAHPEDRASLISALRESIIQKTPFLWEGRIYTPHGKLKWVRAASRHTTRADGVMVKDGLIIDITPQKQVEEELRQAKAAAEAANRSKSQFFAAMSHEFRTPLNGVIGMTSLLDGLELEPIARKYTALAHTSAKSLLSLVNDILDFSKLEAGKTELSPIDFDLHAALNDVGSIVAIKAEDKGLHVKIEIEECVPQWIRADVDRLRQILLNLGTNAVKFTDRGSVTFRVSWTDTDMLLFSVIDTGIGIPQERLERLFKPFSQVDKTTCRKYGGTGLGLFISKQLVDIFGGEMRVNSQPDAGTTFTFTIPLVKANRGEKEPTPCASVTEADGAKLHVLVADDNEINQIVTAAILEQAGHTFEVVSDGREAVDAYATRPFDAILMDCQMPVMDGHEATQAIRKLEAGGVHIPIIALTASAVPGDREACLASGMDDYLTKPIRHAELKEMLERFSRPVCV